MNNKSVFNPVVVIAVLLLSLSFVSCGTDNATEKTSMKEIDQEDFDDYDSDNQDDLDEYYVDEEDEFENQDDETDYFEEEDNFEYESLPPEEEYDEIIASDERYILCSKEVADFEQDETYYGIYDVQTGEWPFEYQAVPGYMGPAYACGSGVFVYSYSAGDLNAEFLSADLNGVFDLSAVMVEGMNTSRIRFVNGRSLIPIRDGELGTDDEGYRLQDIELFWVDTYGNTELANIPGFENSTIYWNDFLLGNDDVFVMLFEQKKDDNVYMYLYVYEIDKTIIIKDQQYTTCSFSGEGISAYYDEDEEVIGIDNLEGKDGEVYYAEFDLDGNVVVPATKL